MNANNYGFVFNDITIEDGIFIKSAKNSHGKMKINNETAFYRYIADNNIAFPMPPLLEHHDGTIKLQYIPDSSTLTSIHNIFGYVTRIKDHLHDIHDVQITVSKDIIMRDLNIELKTKVMGRFNEYEWSSNTLYNSIKSVNGIQIQSVDYYCDIIYDKLAALLCDRRHYSLIHGDIHLGNILLDVGDNILFIDPRGYFGESKLFGLCEYDHAKLLFGLSGYSVFDNMTIKDLVINSNDNIEIDVIYSHEYIFETKEFDEISVLLCLSIWLANNSCFSNINKKITSLMIASYYCEKYICV